MFIDESTYYPQEQRDIAYDAIYVAQAKKFKNLHLAARVERLNILTYSCPTNEEGENDISLLEPTLSHAVVNKSYVYDRKEINALLNSARCGLALSTCEGAMWASIEYLIAGLPIVNVKNKGGRDHYFDEEYVVEVKTTPEAVRDGVDALIERDIDPGLVRDKTISRLNDSRRAFIAYLSGLVGVRKNEDDLFQEIFLDGGIEKHVIDEAQ